MIKIPVYEFLCEKCNIIQEEYLPITSNVDSIKCWKCGEEAKKIISNSTFKLKGGGWYNDSYSKRDGKNE